MQDLLQSKKLYELLFA